MRLKSDQLEILLGVYVDRSAGIQVGRQTGTCSYTSKGKGRERDRQVVNVYDYRYTCLPADLSKYIRTG